MRFVLNIFFILSFFASVLSAQIMTREQKIQELRTHDSQVKVLRDRIEEMETRVGELEEEIISVTDADQTEAESENALAFRIFPRGLLEDNLSVRGGAAYYSFTNKSHDYNDTPQIELQKGNFSVGFYGANFGFISDIGEISLSKVTEQNKSVGFLSSYRPPTIESEARSEYQKVSKGFDRNGANYKKQVSAIVGHSYILRAISFDEADTLVVFKVHRKDTDGSLIIFWKDIKNFETPKLERNKPADDEAKTIDPEMANTVQNALINKRLTNVLVEATTKEITLRGTVPKGKLADAMMAVSEAAAGRRIVNQITEQ